MAAFLAPIFGGLAGLFPKTETTTGSSSTTGNSSSVMNSLLTSLLNTFNQQHGSSDVTTSSTSNPNLSPEALALQKQLAAQYGKQVDQTTNLEPYRSNQAEQINRGSEMQGRNVDSILASRGLATSPVAATSAINVENNRGSQINQLNQSIPLLQQQLHNQALQGASSFYSTIPHGTTTTGTQSGTTDTSGTSTQAGSQSGNSGTSTSMSQNTDSTQTKKSGGGLGGMFGGIGSILANLFG